jgi:hypothetical protein
MELGTETEGSDINFDVFREGIGRTFDFDFVHILFQLTTGNDTCGSGMTGMQGNAGRDLLVVLDSHEVNVACAVTDEVVLDFLEENQLGLVTFLEADQVQFAAGEDFPFRGVDCNRFGFRSLAVDHSGNHALLSQAACICGTREGAALHVQYVFCFRHFVPSSFLKCLLNQ